MRDHFVLALIRLPMKILQQFLFLTSQEFIVETLEAKPSLLEQFEQLLVPEMWLKILLPWKGGKGKEKCSIGFAFGIAAAAGITEAFGGASWTNEQTAVLFLLFSEKTALLLKLGS